MPVGRRDFAATYPGSVYIYLEKEVTTTEQSYTFPLECRGISVYNKGPETVKIRLNKPDADQIELLVEDEVGLDIYVKKIYYVTITGTATIKILTGY